jgi:Tfp pilus assembly protein PilF
MKRLWKPALLSLFTLTLAAGASAQAWGGAGRLHGIVSDENGKPLAGAKVKLVSHKAGGTGPDVLITDAKGKWAALGLIGGRWDVDIEAEGYLPRAISAEISELNRLTPPIKVSLDPKPVEQPKVEDREAIMVGGVEITPEVAAALEAANTYMKEQKWADAARAYETAVAALPDNTQLRFALARAYYGAGEIKKAIPTLQAVVAADATNAVTAALLADMLLEDGQIDEGRKVLASIPAGAITDPNTLLNLGIRFVNNGKPEEALQQFDLAVNAATDFAPAYYYRGIAALQLKKMKEAKADFEKVLQLAPDSQEASDAKDLLAQMK